MGFGNDCIIYILQFAHKKSIPKMSGKFGKTPVFAGNMVEINKLQKIETMFLLYIDKRGDII